MEIKSNGVGRYIQVLNEYEKSIADQAKALGERVAQPATHTRESLPKKGVISEQAIVIEVQIDTLDIKEEINTETISYPYDYSPLDTHRIIVGLWQQAYITLGQHQGLQN